MKKTIVLGASTNPDRYSYKASLLLKKYGHPVIPMGIKKGNIEAMEIITNFDYYKDIDTISLYINPELQKNYYPYILSIRPKRIIFNPGTENEQLRALAQAHGIECDYACNLVLLQTNQY